MANKKAPNRPAIQWDGEEIMVTVPVPENVPRRKGIFIDCKWKPGIVSVIRVRESGADQWSPGFVTPLNACTILDLKPDTEYEMKITHKNKHGEGPPAFAKSKTLSDGSLGSNIIPFPQKD